MGDSTAPQWISCSQHHVVAMSCRGRSRASAGVVVTKAVEIFFDFREPVFNIPVTTSATIIFTVIHHVFPGLLNAPLVVSFSRSSGDNFFPAIFEVIPTIAVVVSVRHLHELRHATITTTAESRCDGSDEGECKSGLHFAI